ncbi:MAG: hypothetical protein GY940_46675, partial [bacterium]|nr:hypothetical protein [bacterium]
ENSGETSVGPGLPLTFTEPLDGPVPRLFSNEPFPQWVTSVYEQTGIDLSLLELLATQTLYSAETDDSKLSGGEISMDIFPLQRGSYILRLEGENNGPTDKAGGFLEYTRYSLEGTDTRQIPLTGQWPQTVSLDVGEPLSFIKIVIKKVMDIKRTGQTDGAIRLKRVTVMPDYRGIIAASQGNSNTGSDR